MRYSNYTIWLTTLLLLLFANACSDRDATVAPGLTPPTVLTVAPSNVGDSCTNAVAKATFSEAMNPATINTSTFTLTGSDGGTVDGVVTYDATSNTATFTSSLALAVSTSYTATITTGAKDMFGNALATSKVWTFTTGLNPCAPPTITSVLPADASTGVCSGTTVIVDFGEPMDPLTINHSTFTLTGPGTTPVAGVVSYGGTKAYFVPSVGLPLSTLFTATVTTGAKDPFGNALASNFVWTFTTSNVVCTQPIVISETPPVGTIGVCPSTVPTATFNEAMNPTTINSTTFTLMGPGTTPVAGVVTYSASTAAFTPSAASRPKHSLYRHHYDRSDGRVRCSFSN